MNRFDATAFLHFNDDQSSDCTEQDQASPPYHPLNGPMGGPTDEPFSAESGSDWTASQGPAEGWLSAAGAQAFFVPLHYEANYRYPLVIWLHSDGFNENQVCHVMPHVSSRNYLATGIRAPKAIDASGHRFSWSESEVGMLRAENDVLTAIDRTAGKYSVHAQRILLAGYCQGGAMAMRIALRNPELFAAAISLGGDFPQEGIPGLDRQRLRDRRLPMLWQRSMLSQRYDESKLVAEITAARSIGAQLEIRQYRNDDEMNTVVLSDLDRWIMNHVVSGTPVAKMDRWETSPTSFSDN